MKVSMVVLLAALAFLFGVGVGMDAARHERVCTHAHVEILDGQAVARCDTYTEPTR